MRLSPHQTIYVVRDPIAEEKLGALITRTTPSELASRPGEDDLSGPRNVAIHDDCESAEQDAWRRILMHQFVRAVDGLGVKAHDARRLLMLDATGETLLSLAVAPYEQPVEDIF